MACLDLSRRPPTLTNFTMDTPSTMTPAQVAAAMVAAGVVKHNTRIDKVFFKAASFLLADSNAYV